MTVLTFENRFNVTEIGLLRSPLPKATGDELKDKLPPPPSFSVAYHLPWSNMLLKDPYDDPLRLGSRREEEGPLAEAATCRSVEKLQLSLTQRGENGSFLQDSFWTPRQVRGVGTIQLLKAEFEEQAICRKEQKPKDVKQG
ncbi:hypothetical protein TREES_T100005246 [Tupaia chinensis]|uniref:Uncharacterized protein n=1 Tax=Tupaia chinensis TaxID=246437 RepID=L9KZC0_TUPCH|nr:hypothetical protein TREES_T100005246 [Tupaia chinensis]